MHILVVFIYLYWLITVIFLFSVKISILNQIKIKDIYFCNTFCLDLMCNKDIKGRKFVCLGVQFLAFSVLLHTKSEQRVRGN